MGYEAVSFVAGEQPSADKWNKLGSNDASFNDGTGIADNAIITRHIADNAITAAEIDLITRSGWLPLTQLTRTADTTATIVGDWTDRLGKGTKLRWLSAGSLRQNYIVSAVYASGTGLTTLTITTGYQTTVGDSIFKSGDAITVMRYSLIDNPVGFTHWFNYAATITTNAGSRTSTNDNTRFKLSGGIMHVSIYTQWTQASASANSVRVTFPLTPNVLGRKNFCGEGSVSPSSDFAIKTSLDATQIYIYKYDSSAAWASGQTCVINGGGVYEY